MKKIGIIVFIFALIVGVVVSNLASFGRVTGKVFSFNMNFGGEKGSGNIKTESREVTNFKSIDVSGAFEVEIIAQKDFTLEVEADDNLLPLIRTEVDGETLKIKSEKGLKTSNPLKIRITAPDINGLELSGASKVNLANLSNDSLSLDSSGASKIKIEGTTGNFDIEMSGASKLDAENLKAENVNVESSGASNLNVFVTNVLKADLSGATNVTYSGGPKSVDKKTSGASSVKEK
jgi:hypothetical protein